MSKATSISNTRYKDLHARLKKSNKDRLESSGSGTGLENNYEGVKGDFMRKGTNPDPPKDSVRPDPPPNPPPASSEREWYTAVQMEQAYKEGARDAVEECLSEQALYIDYKFRYKVRAEQVDRVVKGH